MKRNRKRRWYLDVCVNICPLLEWFSLVFRISYANRWLLIFKLRCICSWNYPPGLLMQSCDGKYVYILVNKFGWYWLQDLGHYAGIHLSAGVTLFLFSIFSSFLVFLCCPYNFSSVHYWIEFDFCLPDAVI